MFVKDGCQQRVGQRLVQLAWHWRIGLGVRLFAADIILGGSFRVVVWVHGLSVCLSGLAIFVQDSSGTLSFCRVLYFVSV